MKHVVLMNIWYSWLSENQTDMQKGCYKAVYWNWSDSYSKEIYIAVGIVQILSNVTRDVFCETPVFLQMITQNSRHEVLTNFLHFVESNTKEKYTNVSTLLPELWTLDSSRHMYQNRKFVLKNCKHWRECFTIKQYGWNCC
jgi:hypothetical protein